MGLDPKVLSEIINIASGRCWSSDTYNPCPGVIEGVPSGNNYQGGFRTALMAKVRLSHFIIYLYLRVITHRIFSWPRRQLETQSQ